MSNLLDVVRAAVQPETITDSLDGNVPGASASQSPTPPSAVSLKEEEMSDPQNKPGAGNADAGHAEAIAAARKEGHAEGVKTATDRFAAALGADGIKGDGKRMGAALDLAVGSADMSAETVVAFVKANVPETKADAGGQWGSYAARRLAAANMAAPEAGQDADKKAAGKAVLAEAVDRTNKRRK